MALTLKEALEQSSTQTIYGKWNKDYIDYHTVDRDDLPDWIKAKEPQPEPTTLEKIENVGQEIDEKVNEVSGEIVDTFRDKTDEATQQAQQDYTDYQNDTPAQPVGLSGMLESVRNTSLNDIGNTVSDSWNSRSDDYKTELDDFQNPVQAPQSLDDNWLYNAPGKAANAFLHAGVLGQEMGDKVQEQLGFTANFVKSTELYNNFNFMWGTPEKNYMSEELGRAYGVDPSIFFNDRDAYIKGAKLLASFKTDDRVPDDVDRNAPENFRSYLKEYYTAIVNSTPDTFEDKLKNAEDVKQITDIFKLPGLVYDIWANTAERNDIYRSAYIDRRYLTDEEVDRAEELTKRLNALSKQIPQITDHPLYGVLTQTAVQVAGMGTDSAVGGVAAGVVGAGVLGATGNPIAAKTAAGYAFKAGTMAGMFLRQVGDKYVEYLSYQNQDNTRTLNPNQAAIAATIETGIETGIEFWNFNDIMRTLGGKDRATIQDIVRENHGNAEAIRGGLKAYLANSVKAWAPRVKEEVLEEAYQSATDDIVHNAIVAMNPQTKEEYITPGQIAVNSTEAMVQAVPSVVGMIAAGDVISNIRSVRNLASIYELHKNLTEEEINNAELGSILKDVQENQKTSKLAKENPRAYMQVLKAEADKAGIPNVYVDTEMLMQEPGGREVIEKLGEQSGYTKAQVQETINSKGELEVPTAVYCQVALPSSVGDKVIDMTMASPNVNSQARIKSTIDRITRTAKALAEQDENEVKEIIPTIVENNFHSDEERMLATEIISKDPGHIQRSYRDTVSSTQKELNDILQGTIDIEEADSRDGDTGSRVIKNENLYDSQGLTTNKATKQSKFWTDYFGQKTPTQAQKRQYAYAVLTGQVKGGPRSLGVAYDMAMQNGDTEEASQIKAEMQANKEKLDGLQHNLDVLKVMKDKLGSIPSIETTITRGLTPEGYRVYRAANDLLSGSTNDKVRKQARMGGILFARQCENLAREMTAQGKKTTAEDVAGMLNISTSAQETSAVYGKNTLFKMKPSAAKTLAEFYLSVKNGVDSNGKDKTYYSFTTKWGDRIDVPQDECRHFGGKHKLNTKQFDAIEKNFSNIIDYEWDTKKKGHNGGSVCRLKIGSPEGVFGATLEVLNNGRTFLTTAFYDTEKNINNWLHKEKAPRTTTSHQDGEASSSRMASARSILDVIGYVKNVAYKQTAWHGSPYNFDKFTLDHIGEGEGAQVHGYGLYFAKNKGTSNDYKERFNREKNVGAVYYHDQLVYDDGGEFRYVSNGALVDTQSIGEEWALGEVGRVGKEQAVKNLEKEAGGDNPARVKNAKEALKILQEGYIKPYFEIPVDPKLYQVDVPDNKDLLDDDKPYGKQSDGIKKRIQKAYAGLTDEQKAEFAKRLLPITTYSKEEIETDNRAKAIEAVIRNLQNLSQDHGEIPKFRRNILTQLFAKLGYTQEDVDNYISNKTEAAAELEKLKRDTAEELDALKSQAGELAKAREQRDADNHSRLFEIMDANPTLDRYSGREIYNAFQMALGTPKAASEQLNQSGIKGITYNGGRDGRCFVVFDDKAISIVEKYNQQRARIQGQTSFPDGKPLISLFEAADQSTFMHETAHWYLDSMRKLALNPNATRQFTEDFYTLQQWFGNKSLDAEITTEQHEKFARGFEAYLRNGKAPAPQLKSVFNRFKNWLTRLYRDFKELGGKPSEDVTRVMDRMLTTQDEIDRAMKEQMVDDFKRAGGLKTMSGENAHTWERWYNKVRQEAEEKVMAQAMRDLVQADQKDIQEAIDAQRQIALGEMKQDPFWIADEAYRATGDESILATFNLTPQEYADELKKRGGSIQVALDARMEGFEKETRDSARDVQTIAEEAKKAVQTSEYQEMLHALEYEALAQKARQFIVGEDDKAKRAQAKENKRVAKENAEAEAAAEKARKISEKLTMREEARNSKVNEARAEVERVRKGMRIVRDMVLTTLKERREAARIAMAKLPINQATNVALWARKLGQKQNDVYNYMTQGRWDLAARAKQEQLMMAAMVTESGKLKVQIDKQAAGIQKRIQTLQKGTERMPTQARYWYQHIAYVLGLSRGDGLSPAGGAKTLQDVFNEMAGFAQNGAPEVVVPQWLNGMANQNGRVGMGKLSPDQWSKAVDIMKALYKMGMDKDNLHVVSADGVNPTISETAQALTANMIEHNGRHPRADIYSNNTFTDKRKQNLRDAKEYVGSFFTKLINPLTVMQRMDGYEGKVGRSRAGMAIKTLYDPVERATNAEIKLMAEFAEGLKQAFGQYTGEELDDLHNKRIYRFGDRLLTKEEIMCLALTSGTESGYKRILDNEDIGDKEYTSLTQRETAVASALNDALSNLDERDWNTVTKVWELMGSHYADESGIKERTTGIPLGRLAHRKFSVNGKDGKAYTLEGGYYPVAYDSSRSARASDLETQDALRSMSPGNLRMGQGKGFTKSRERIVTGRPLKLSFDTISNKGAEMMHYIAFRETALDVNHLINNKGFAQAIVDSMGMDEYHILQQWASDIWQAPKESQAVLDRIVRSVRTKTTSAVLAYRTSTMLLNASNAALMAEHVGAANFLDYIRKFYSEPERNWRFVNGISPFMAERSERMDTNLREAMEKSQLKVKRKSGNPILHGIQSIHDAIMDNGFKLIGLTDNMFAYPLWYGSYIQTLNEELQKGKTNAEAQKQAIAAGDRAVIRVIGSGEMKDLSQFQKGSELARTLTMFYSFQNALYNMLANKVYAGVQNAERAGKTGWRRFASSQFIAPMAHHLLIGVMMGAAVETAIRGAMDAMSGDDDKEKKDAAYWLTHYMETATGNQLATIPLVRDIWRPISQAIFYPKEPFSLQKDRAKMTSAYDTFIQMANAGVTLRGATLDKKGLSDIVREGGRAINRMTGNPDMITDGLANAIEYYTAPETERDLQMFIGKTLMDRKYPKPKTKKTKTGKNTTNKKNAAKKKGKTAVK